MNNLTLTKSMTKPCSIHKNLFCASRILIGSLFALLGFIAQPDGHCADTQRPKIVLMLADDLGWEDLPSYGNQAHRTPHLDQLAAEGMRFTDAYAAPTCSPARASLLTGKAPARVGITDFIAGKLGGSVPNPKGQGYPYPGRSKLVQPDMTDPGV
jgi:predicted AlkP superfamily pyrophosphatase or phosphodiesterase